MLEAIAEQFMLSQTSRQANSEPIIPSRINVTPIIPELTLRPSFRNRRYARHSGIERSEISGTHRHSVTSPLQPSFRNLAQRGIRNQT